MWIPHAMISSECGEGIKIQVQQKLRGGKVYLWILNSKFPAQSLVHEKPRTEECWKSALEIQTKDNSSLACFFFSFQQYFLLVDAVDRVGQSWPHRALTRSSVALEIVFLSANNLPFILQYLWLSIRLLQIYLGLFGKVPFIQWVAVTSNVVLIIIIITVEKLLVWKCLWSQGLCRQISHAPPTLKILHWMEGTIIPWYAAPRGLNCHCNVSLRAKPVPEQIDIPSSKWDKRRPVRTSFTSKTV